MSIMEAFNLMQAAELPTRNSCMQLVHAWIHISAHTHACAHMDICTCAHTHTRTHTARHYRQHRSSTLKWAWELYGEAVAG